MVKSWSRILTKAIGKKMGMVKVCSNGSQPEVVEMKKIEIRHHGIGRLIRR